MIRIPAGAARITGRPGGDRGPRLSLAGSRKWAQEVEGLRDLLVHGPLVRILLLDFALRSQPGVVPRGFSIRMQAPIFVDTPVRLVGRETDSGSEVFVLSGANQVLARGTVAAAG